MTIPVKKPQASREDAKVQRSVKSNLPAPVANREFPDRPILCAGGVVIEGNAVLLICRSNAPQKDEWTLPGGMVELGEKVTSAVRREIREETGLTVEPVALVSVFERILHVRNRVRYHYTVLDYLCRRKHGRLKAASDVSDARWVRRKDLGRYRLRQSAAKVIRQAFAMVENLK